MVEILGMEVGEGMVEMLGTEVVEVMVVGHNMKVDSIAASSSHFVQRFNRTLYTASSHLTPSRNSYAVTAEGMCALSGLVNLKELDLERCSGVHGGFVHLKGLKKLETLNARYCKCITDSDLKALSEVKSLKELQVSCSTIHY